jgi:hypothetical protein
MTRKTAESHGFVDILADILNLVFTMSVKLTIDNTTTGSNNYKELYDCKWDSMTLMNNTLYIPIFKFL